VDFILKDHDRRYRISIDMEIVGAAHVQEAVVVAVQVDDVLPAFDPLGITRHRDDVLEDDIVSEQVEVVLAINEVRKPFSNGIYSGGVSGSSCLA